MDPKISKNGDDVKTKKSTGELADEQYKISTEQSIPQSLQIPVPAYNSFGSRASDDLADEFNKELQKEEVNMEGVKNDKKIASNQTANMENAMEFKKETTDDILKRAEKGKIPRSIFRTLTDEQQPLKELGEPSDLGEMVNDDEN